MLRVEIVFVSLTTISVYAELNIDFISNLNKGNLNDYSHIKPLTTTIITIISAPFISRH